MPRAVLLLLCGLQLLCGSGGSVHDVVEEHRAARHRLRGKLLYDKSLLCASPGVHGLMNKTAGPRHWDETDPASVQAYLQFGIPIYFRSMLYVSDKHKFIYVRHSKASSTSLRRMLAAQFCTGACRDEELRYVVNTPIPPAKWREYFVFTFVRNPWTRMASAYEFFHAKLVATKRADGSVGDKCTTVPFGEFARNTYSMARACGLRRCCILEPAAGPPGKPPTVRFNQDNLNHHIGELSHYVFSTRGESMVDFIGSTERLREDWEELLTHLGRHNGVKYEAIARMETANQLRSSLEGACSSSYYERLYDDATLRAIAAQYAIDVERFQYYPPELLAPVAQKGGGGAAGAPPRAGQRAPVPEDWLSHLLWQPRRRSGGGAPPPPRTAAARLLVDIVVAHCREDLAWLPAVLADLERQGVQAAVFIYDKCAMAEASRVACPEAAVAELPNVGREAHTYLHHMATRGAERAAVSNVTLFLQGAPHSFPLNPVQMATALVAQAMKHGLSTNVVRTLPTELAQFEAKRSFDMRAGGVRVLTPHWNGTLGDWFDSRATPHLGAWLPQLLPVAFYRGACFAVRSELRLPAPIVAAALADVGVSSRPGAAHYLERSWFYMFWALRERRAREGAGAGWEGDGVGPFLPDNLATRGEVSDVRPAAVGGLPWEGCTVDGAERSSTGEPSYVCAGLRAEDRSSWSWEVE